MTDPQDFKNLITERFGKLPKPVQNAILSGDPEKRLRELSEKHQLHLDQWEEFENVIMLTLLGIYDSLDLEKHIVEDVRVQPEAARAIAEDSIKIVFEPIRETLERELEHPEAKTEEKSGVEKLRDQKIAENRASDAESQAPRHEAGGVSAASKPRTATEPAQQSVFGTPPQPKPVIKVERAPVSPVYKPKESSVERKHVDGDPYREPVL